MTESKGSFDETQQHDFAAHPDEDQNLDQNNNDVQEQRSEIGVNKVDKLTWKSIEECRIARIKNTMMLVRCLSLMWKMTGDESMLASLDNQLAHLKLYLENELATNCDITSAFLHSERPFGNEDAEIMLAEITSRYPRFPKADPVLIVVARGHLQANGLLSGFPSEFMLPALLELSQHDSSHLDEAAYVSRMKSHLDIFDLHRPFEIFRANCEYNMTMRILSIGLDGMFVIHDRFVKRLDQSRADTENEQRNKFMNGSFNTINYPDKRGRIKIGIEKIRAIHDHKLLNECNMERETVEKFIEILKTALGRTD